MGVTRNAGHASGRTRLGEFGEPRRHLAGLTRRAVTRSADNEGRPPPGKKSIFDTAAPRDTDARGIRTTMRKKPVTQTKKTGAAAAVQNLAVPAIHCAYTALAEPAALKPHPQNVNTHPPAQLRVYQKVIQANGWRRPVVVSKRSGYIVKGHGAWLTAQAAGWLVPIEYQDYASEAEELRDHVADNELAKAAETDQVKLEALLAAMPDVELAGIMADLPDVTNLPDLPAAPASVQENLEHMASIKAQRKRGNQNIVAKTDTEHYLVIIFRDRTAREAALRLLGLPTDERYLPADTVKLSRRRSVLPPMLSAVGAKAAQPNKAGACG